MKKLTTEEFINRATMVHGDKYDYSKVKYVNSESKVCIVCRIHGPFYQRPSTHLIGCGCVECGGSSKLTTAKFIERAKSVHGNYYDYSKTQYVRGTEKVCIICPIHGEFWQIASNHMQGARCPLCFEKKLHTKETFIISARRVHGDRYDYSEIEYVNNKHKIGIRCHEHGIFNQRPDNHIHGYGCPQCRGELMSRQQTDTIEEFIKKAKISHGDYYDYSMVVYVGSKIKVDIICPKHGIFQQTPMIHIAGCGCPICCASSGEVEVSKTLATLSIDCLSEKRFKDCIDVYPLPFDFYIPDQNLLIEYDGIQHFEPIAAFGGESAFAITQYHDKIKTQFCKTKNIQLLRIPYWDYDNIEVILLNALK